MRSNRRRTAFLLFCVAPAVILFVIFMVVPTFNVFRLSLFQRNAFNASGAEFIGPKNFLSLLEDATFIRSMQNMLLLIVMVTIFTMGTALVFASILTRDKLRGNSFFRIVFYIPNILSVVVISGIFSAIYDVDKGLLNSTLSYCGELISDIASFISRGAADWDFGKVNIQWKGEQHVITSLVIAMVWQAIGYYMVMYMSSMGAVPDSTYEAADIDGANRFQQFFQITLPLIWTNIRTTLTFFIISTINMAFLFVTAMTSGGPNNASNVSLLYMYEQKSNGSYGYAMAIGVVIFLVSFALSALVNKVTEREVLEY